MRFAPQSRQATFSAPLSSANAAFLWDHQVSGKPLFPGAGYFEIALSSLNTLKSSDKSVCCVVGAFIPAPLVLPSPANTRVAGSVLLISVSSALARLEIASMGSNAKPTTHLAAGIGATVALEEVSAATPGSRVLQGVLQRTRLASSGAACATVMAPLHDASAYSISPSVLDNCLQLGAATPRADGQLFVPAGVGALAMQRKPDAASTTSAVALPIGTSVGTSSTLTDYDLIQVNGGGCRVDCLEAKPLAGAARRAAAATGGAKTESCKGNLMYQIDWLRHSSITETSSAIDALSKGIEIGGLSTAASLAGAMSLAQGAASGRLKGISFLTNGAAIGVSSQTIPHPMGKATDAAGLWGLARTLAAELPSQTTAVDLAGCGPTAHPVVSLSESGSTASLPLLDSSPYGCRLEGGALTAATLVSAAVSPAMPPSRLFPTPRGALQNLLPEVLPNKPLGAGRVFVAVKAVGINFRDVLNVLGMYPGDPGPPGGDCAGVVVAVGPDSNGLKSGTAL